jgi:hypothetical protein
VDEERREEREGEKRGPASPLPPPRTAKESKDDGMYETDETLYTHTHPKSHLGPFCFWARMI